MGPRLGRVAVAGLCLALLAGAAELARARQPDTGPGPMPTEPPPAPDIPPPPVIDQAQPPVERSTPVPDEPPPPRVRPRAETPPPPQPKALAEPPPGPPRPVRGVVAILQVLDKVTAETLQFEAPVGKRIRYKTLVFAVKVCETRGLDDPQPRPSAYVLIDSQAGAIAGRAPPPAKQVFKGWMFANGPGLHPLEHPVYDAWLVSCGAAVPGA